MNKYLMENLILFEYCLLILQHKSISLKNSRINWRFVTLTLKRSCNVIKQIYSCVYKPVYSFNTKLWWWYTEKRFSQGKDEVLASTVPLKLRCVQQIMVVLCGTRMVILTCHLSLVTWIILGFVWEGDRAKGRASGPCSAKIQIMSEIQSSENKR